MVRNNTASLIDEYIFPNTQFSILNGPQFAPALKTSHDQTPSNLDLAASIENRGEPIDINHSVALDTGCST